MQQVSTNLTLFFKVFLPTFWLSVFGLFGIVVWVSDYQSFGGIPTSTFRIGYSIFYLIFLALFYFTVMKLKRVEMDKDGVYVTNYFKHYRYPWANIEKMTEAPFPFVKIITILLKEPGSFGKKIHFIPSRKKLDLFLGSHPEVSKSLLQKEKV